MTTETASDVVAEEIDVERGQPDVHGHAWRWIAGRLAAGVLLVFLVSVLVFLATQALPGDPVQAILGRNQTPARVAAVKHELHLDRSLASQYWSWLSGVLTGDFGTSLVSGQRVSSLIGDRMVASFYLLAFSALIAIPLAICLGVVSAARRDGLLDKGALVSSLVLTALPEFVIGIALVIVFATTVFTWLPSVTLLPSGDSPLQHPDQLVLPIATLVLAIVPYLFRLARASTIDVLASDYVTMARLKGLSERTILRRHALPNALIPTVQASAVVLSFLLGGVVVVEFVFNYPGLGTTLTSAISSRDVPLVQAIVLIFAAGVVVFNLIADVLTVLLTPRLRTASGR